MKCKNCGHEFHWCLSCGTHGLEAESEGYCSEDCWEEHDPKGYEQYWADDGYEMDCRDYPV